MSLKTKHRICLALGFVAGWNMTTARELVFFVIGLALAGVATIRN